MAVTEIQPIEQERSLEQNTRRLHVVMVSESSLSHTSGVTTSVDHVARCLQADGHRVTIICPGPAPDRLEAAAVIATDYWTIKGFNIGRAMFPKKFRQLFRDLKPDVVHAAAPFGIPTGFLFLGRNAVHAARTLDIPITAVYQTDAVRFAPRLGLGPLAAQLAERQIQQIHNMADINLAPSVAAAQDLRAWGVRPESIFLWARGVDTELFDPARCGTAAVADLRKRWAPDGEVIIGYVGRLEPEKTVERLVALQDIVNTKLIIVGKGSCWQNLERLLGSRAIFTGELRGGDLANAYAAFDIFSFTSITDTFGQVLQEAKAAGLPLVAPNVGGPRDIVEHGRTGFLYNPQSNARFRHYVELLAVDEELRNIMGRAGRISVEDCSWRAFGVQIVDHYRKAIGLQRLQLAATERLGDSNLPRKLR